jgi:hypothetical protein
MKSNKWLKLVITLSLFFLLTQTVLAVTITDSDTLEISDVQYTSSTGFGPGSSIPLSAPVDVGYVYITSKEPVQVTWTIYAPGFKEVTTLTHPPSTKGQQDGQWYFADNTAFVVPAFAEKGTWICSLDVKFSDGSSGSVGFGDYTYLGFPVTSSGDIFTNLFGAPWYLSGIMMPPIFWFPLIILWGPALFIGICFIFPQLAETFKKGISRVQGARGK